MTMRDPVCGMIIDERDAAGTATFGAVTYHFCTASCLDAFNRDPGRFSQPLSVETSRPPAPAADVAVHRPPGTTRCPYCGGDARGALEARPVVGRLSREEFETLVRGEWRRRVGGSAYAREHSRDLVRALFLYALAPDEPAYVQAVERLLAEREPSVEETAADAPAARDDGLPLSAAFWDVLSNSGLPLDQAARLMEIVDRRLQWHSPGPQGWTRTSAAAGQMPQQPRGAARLATATASGR